MFRDDAWCWYSIQHWQHNPEKIPEIRVVSSLYMLPHTRKEKTNFSFILYLCWDWSERHPMKVEIPHRVMCGRKKNTNGIPTYAKMMISHQNDDTYSNLCSKWWSNCRQIAFHRHNVHTWNCLDDRNKFWHVILAQYAHMSWICLIKVV